MSETKFTIKGKDGDPMTEDQLAMAASAAHLRLVRDQLVKFRGLDDSQPGIDLWLLGQIDMIAENLQVRSNSVFRMVVTDSVPGPCEHQQEEGGGE